MSTKLSRKTKYLIFLLTIIVLIATQALGFTVKELFSKGILAFFIAISMVLTKQFTKADI